MPAAVYKADGRALKWWRAKRRLTLHQLADLAGVSYTQISRIETGQSLQPRFATVERLASALKIDADELLIYEDLNNGR